MLPGTKCIVFRKVPAIYFPVELYMRDRRKHASPGEGKIIFNLCEYSQQCTTNTGRDLKLDGDVKCSQHCVVAQQLWKTTIQAHLSSDNVYWLIRVMEEYYSGLLAALSNWWKEGEILWKEKITIINCCGFCLVPHLFRGNSWRRRWSLCSRR